MIASPCVNVCQMDDATGVCRGCCRTLDEIARWASMNDEERAQVRSLLDGRREAYFGPGLRSR